MASRLAAAAASDGRSASRITLLAVCAIGVDGVPGAFALAQLAVFGRADASMPELVSAPEELTSPLASAEDESLRRRADGIGADEGTTVLPPLNSVSFAA